VTFVRIVLADPKTGRVPDGSAVNGRALIVLADDTGHRAVPLWLRVIGAKLLWGVLDRRAGNAGMAGAPEETAVRLLHAAGVAVTAVDIEPASEDVLELRSDTAAARVGLATAAGTRHVLVSAEYGLKLAAAAGAPVRLADAVMDRLAVPVQGEDVLAPFLLPATARPLGSPAQRTRFEPRNMAFTDGLDRSAAGLRRRAGRGPQPARRGARAVAGAGRFVGAVAERGDVAAARGRDHGRVRRQARHAGGAACAGSARR